MQCDTECATLLDAPETSFPMNLSVARGTVSHVPQAERAAAKIPSLLLSFSYSRSERNATRWPLQRRTNSETPVTDYFF